MYRFEQCCQLLFILALAAHIILRFINGHLVYCHYFTSGLTCISANLLSVTDGIYFNHIYSRLPEGTYGYFPAMMVFCRNLVSLSILNSESHCSSVAEVISGWHPVLLSL